MHNSSDFQDLVPRIYEAAGEPEAWPDVLETIRRGADVSTTLLGVMPPGALWQGNMWGANLDPSSVDACMRRGVIDCSVFARALMLMPECTLRDLSAAGEGAVYDDLGARALLGAQSLTEGRFGTIARDDAQLSGLACLNETRRGPLEDGAIAWIGKLLPHLSRSIALNGRIEQLHRDGAALRAALGHFSVGVMVVNGDLTLRFANAEAERILRESDGLGLRARRLRPGSLVLEARLRATIAALATGSGDAGPACLFVARPSGLPPYTLVVAPMIAGAGPSAPVPSGAAATLFVSDRTGPAALPGPALIAAAFGLTATEAEVARLVAVGRGLGFVAESLGISLNTARTHLKAIYGKTGVHHQAALARTIADRFPPIRGLAESADN